MNAKTDCHLISSPANVRRVNFSFASKYRLLYGYLAFVLLSGCASYGVIHNDPETNVDAGKPYSVSTWAQSEEASNMVFILAFSGGGTRAAAMAYGVLEELRDTPITIDGRQRRLLDEVTHISSVSGGSFTSAYYGLYGNKIFDDFEDEFLKKNVQKHLTWSLLRPLHWFGRKDRTERSSEYYNKILFHDATFKDMLKPDRPMIIINASDLAEGLRFSFIQDYFDLLCSDVRDYPIASAVTASSAVPVVFNPIVLENYSGCPEFKASPQLASTASRNDEIAQVVAGMESYNDKVNRKYIQYVDGGITDNMGLRAINDVLAVSGGPAELISREKRKIPSHVVFLSVNASTLKETKMGLSNKQPSMLASMNAMTDIQLHRYNAATIDSVRNNLATWSAELSTPEHKVTSHFIDVNFEGVAQPQLKLFLNKIPTSFSLTEEQVDTLIKSARDLLKSDPVYQSLLKELANSAN